MRAGVRRAAGVAFAASLLLTGGCEPASLGEQAGPPATAVARISTARGDFVLRVEVARTADERSRGLMDRAALGEDEGMLFLYSRPRPGDAGFWMYRTPIPLDIAFIDPRGRIVALRTMAPCQSSDPDHCPVYLPNAAYQSALEVNAGLFARHGVGVGDRLELLAGMP